MQKGLKIALLGYGKIAENQHLPSINQNKKLELNAVIEPNLNTELSAKHYPDLTSFLNSDNTTDLVSITTPNGLHFQQAIQCLKAGKHVLVEKPLTLNVEDAEILISLSKEKNLRVFSSMQLRFSPAVQFLKELITKGSLGKIFMVNVNCYWNRNKAYYESKPWHGSESLDGGVLFTQFSHFIDVLGFWFDDLSVQSANFYNFTHQDCTDFADSGNVHFKADEAVGNMIFTTSTYPKNFESSITIVAEKGTIQIGDQYLNRFKYFNVEGMEAPIFLEEKAFHPNLYTEIIEALEENRPSVVDGQHAIKLIKFIEEAHQIGTLQKKVIRSSK